MIHYVGKELWHCPPDVVAAKPYTMFAKALIINNAEAEVYQSKSKSKSKGKGTK